MEKHSFPLQEEATEQTPLMDSARLFKFLTLYAILAASHVICKTRKNKLLPQRTLCVNISTSFPCPRPLRWRRPEGCRNNLQPAARVAKHRPKH